MSNIKPPGGSPISEWDRSKSGSKGNVESASLVFNQKTTREVTKEHVRDIMGGLAEIARDLGLTNKEKEFADEMADDIFKALQKVSRRQKEQGGNREKN